MATDAENQRAADEYNKQLKASMEAALKEANRIAAEAVRAAQEKDKP